MITREQALTENIFHEPRNSKNCARWRRNGKTKLWKTRPTEFRVPIKWGLKTCGYLTQENMHLFHTVEDCPNAR